MKEQIVKEWVEWGKHDLDVAKLLLNKKEYYDVTISHIHQAVEKYLKAFLVYNGWGLKKIHDIELLITEAANFDKMFEQYLNFGRELTAFYYEDRYPPGPITPYSKKKIEVMIKTAEKIISRIKKDIKNDR